MDNSPMTGGCHYPMECKRYKIGCGSCPSILWGGMKNDITKINVLKDLDLLIKCGATVLCPTSTSLEEAEDSYKLAKLKKKLLLIPLTDDYSEKLTKLEARDKLSIYSTEKIIFFGAEDLNHERKGMMYLIKALRIVFNELNIDERKNVQLLIAGESNFKIVKDIGFSYTMLGYLDQAKLKYAYKAADVFISPSIEDMGPMMVSESIKSGTPVLSFNVGISKDLVINGITGYRAATKDCDALARNILTMLRLTDREINEMSLNCYQLGDKLLSFKTFYSSIGQIFLKAGK